MSKNLNLGPAKLFVRRDNPDGTHDFVEVPGLLMYQDEIFATPPVEADLSQLEAVMTDRSFTGRLDRADADKLFDLCRDPPKRKPVSFYRSIPPFAFFLMAVALLFMLFACSAVPEPAPVQDDVCYAPWEHEPYASGRAIPAPGPDAQVPLCVS